MHVSYMELIHYLNLHCFVILMHLEHFVKLFPSCADKRHWTLLRFEGDLTPNRLGSSGGGPDLPSIRDTTACLCVWRDGHSGGHTQ